MFEVFTGFRKNDSPDSDVIGIEVNGADESLVSIGKGGGPFASAAGFFTAAHHEMAAKIEAFCVHLEAVARNELGTHLGELALAEFWKMIEEPLGENELEDGIAEEFQTLIIEVMALGFVAERRMSKRFREEERIAKLVFQPLFERIHRLE